MPIPIEALNSILKGRNMTLPNGGGTYNTANTTPMTMGQPIQAPVPAVAPQPVVQAPPAVPATPTPAPSPTPGPVTSPMPAPTPSPAPVPGTNTAEFDPLKAYRDLALEQAMHSSQGTGLYAMQKGVQYSPEQIMAQRKSADQLYSQALGEYANLADEYIAKQKQAGKPELTAGQTSAFNSIVNAKNKSPLLAASDRLPVLQNAIKEARANPTNGSLQLNLVYSYVQALDTYQSAVREGELSLVNSIDSKVGQLGNFVSQIQNGQIVRPEVIKQMADAAENIVNTINTSAKKKNESFRAQARAQGLGDVWDRYEGGYESSFNSDTGSTKSNGNSEYAENW